MIRADIQLKPEIYEMVDNFISPELVDWLNTIIISRPWIFVNYWSFVHLSSGIIFYKFFSKKFKNWVIINIIFETVEYMCGNHPLFIEEAIDVVWDLIFSLGGFKLSEKYKIKRKQLKWLKRN